MRRSEKVRFHYTMPTEVFFGENVIEEHGDVLRRLGRRAFVITGRSSSKNGSLDEVIALLSRLKIDHRVSKEMEENPSFSLVERITDKVKKFEPDFLVGIGGGSVLDSMKAVAILSVNDLKPPDLYDESKYSKALPTVAIPTTAGTGSEVTEYSVLTNDETKMKGGFKSPLIFPKYSFLDPRYTLTMSTELTIATGLDALSHSVESMLSTRSNRMSEIFALRANELIFQSLPDVLENPNDLDARSRMLFASMLAGVSIAQTGTTIIHALGYPLSTFKNLKHGLANAVLMVQTLRMIEHDAPKSVLRAIRPMGNLEDFEEFLRSILSRLNLRIDLERSEMEEWARIGSKAKHLRSTPGRIGYDEILKIYETLIDEYGKS